MAAVATVMFSFLVLVPTLVDANAFLRPQPEAPAEAVGPELERALLGEIEEVMGTDHRQATERRLGRIEALLRPTVKALPKNEHGRLGHAAARYATHRFFVQRHAWFVRGLEPGGDAWNASSPTVVLKDRLPEYVQNLFEARVGGRGFDLHELAVLAATLENLVHHEALDRLKHTYRGLERSTQDPLSPEESHEVIDTYMVGFITGLNFSATTPAVFQNTRLRINELYPTWSETQNFLREVQNMTVPRHVEELSYENIASVVEEVGERYGRWQDKECRDLKAALVSIEDRGTGRVRLGDFYGGALKGDNWQFSESVDYLRQLGALDESDPANLRVIVPNYIMSPSNCVASSSYYSVCCADECEDILGHLEQQLGKHEAAPGEISSLVALLPSATVSANRTLSDSLLQRLDEVAQHHGGRIPLHGRLFAQWMHHAYPRECPYPHVTGTTNPMRSKEFRAETGRQVAAAKEEMEQHAESQRHRPQDKAAAEDYSMWSMEEELVCKHHVDVEAVTSLRGTFRVFVFVAAVVSVFLGLFKSFGHALIGVQDDELAKCKAQHYV